MSTAWERYHRRAAIVRQVLARLEATGGTAPWQEYAEVFGDRDDLLRELHRVWSTRLAARVENALECDHHEQLTSVVQAWREVAAELPALRRLLDQHAGDPAIWRATRREHRMLAVAAGLATLTDPEDHAVAEGVRLTTSLTNPTPRTLLSA
ncbi:MAG: hypothetical protein ACRDT4_06595 [Micromonosporaceae bacterium]